MADYDLADITRGRRIVAVAAVDMKLIPRRRPRPRMRLLRRVWMRIVRRVKGRVAS
jgi:hypothetical protein